jgi:hypothetical protein
MVTRIVQGRAYLFGTAVLRLVPIHVTHLSQVINRGLAQCRLFRTHSRLDIRLTGELWVNKPIYHPKQNVGARE